MLKFKYKHFFLLPGLIVLVAIIIFPLLFTIRVSFSSWDVVKPGLDWLGGKNYGRLFVDLRFWEALTRLSMMAVGSVMIQYVLGFGLALMVWRDVILKRFVRVLFLVPMMTTPVIMSVIWRTILHESLGPANDIVQLFGFQPLTWLSTGGMEEVLAGHPDVAECAVFGVDDQPTVSGEVVDGARDEIRIGGHEDPESGGPDARREVDRAGVSPHHQRRRSQEVCELDQIGGWRRPDPGSGQR